MTLEPKGPPNGGEPNQGREIIVLARWSTRFWAWLVDFIIVNAALGVLFGLLSIPMWLYGFTNPMMMSPTYGNAWWNGFVGPLSFGINSLAFFGYWLFMESKYNGQSIGKMLLHIRTTNLEGKQADVKSVAISSLGKSILLILDVLLGWIFTNDKRQRLLSRAANTIVIKVQEEDTTNSPPQNVRYRKE